ncbi:XRE family transcriptional regulator [Actinocorallia sp. API 0066]|uniref:helix-turn-helix domain-containing protein n=1 Tax=Actinocorallia sp. API 0066 TaxID=2896846 RepID=UPI001E4B9C2A|nr:XRE family transcriptional regulator [Actinocorallia sp. API 0066]MCD0453451.1 XRE family transcriptional regulator [Actinocorallia sp. API 0066]
MDDEQRDLARSLGASIRAARKRAGLTLTELAKEAGVSQPFLSQAENGNVMPSVINLHRVAKALGTTAHQLLESGARRPATVVRAGASRSYPLGPDATVRFCIEGNRALDCNEVTAGPRSAAEAPTTHEGEEFVYVIEGRVRMVIGGSDYLLGPGDTVTYTAALPHQWFNDEDAPARFLFTSTPPGF